MEKVTLNPGAYGVVDIDAIAVEEIIPVKYESEEDWPDDYVVSVWDRDKKNKQFVDRSPIEKSGKELIWIIDPKSSDLIPDIYYYEITNITKSYREVIGALIISK